MICSKCGVQNIDGVTFCGSCGAIMESYIQQAPKQNISDLEVSNQQPQNQQQAADASQYQRSNTSVGSGGGPYNGGMIVPKNYMVESIIVTVISFICCCCSPVSVILGIIAMVKASKVIPEFERGNISEAINCSETAKKLTIWAAIIAVVFAAICWIAYFSFINTIINQSGGWDEFLRQYSS